MKRWHWLVIVPAIMLGLAACYAMAQAPPEAVPTPPSAAAAAETVSKTTAEPFIDRLWKAQGLMHPVVVHFPIAMIIGAALAVVLRLFIRRISPGVVYYCLLIGAMGAIVSTLAGWAWAPSRGYGDLWDMEGEMFWHRWGGVTVTAAAILVSLWATQRIRKPESKQVGWQLAVLVLAAMIGLVGHQGGELVYPDNLAKFWATLTGERKRTPPPQMPGAVAQTPDTLPGPAPAPGDGIAKGDDPQDNGVQVQPSTNSASDNINFTTEVWPILQTKCIECHGPDKRKGKFRMDTQESALAGGSSDEPGYIAGNPGESLMIRLITAEDELDRMPPVDEGEPITPEELSVLVKWIEQGAVWNAPPAATSSTARTGG